MRPARVEVRILAQGATSLRGFNFLYFITILFATHIFSAVVHAVSCLYLNIFSILQLKNEPRDRDKEHAFILESYSTFANMPFHPISLPCTILPPPE